MKSKLSLRVVATISVAWSLFLVPAICSFAQATAPPAVPVASVAKLKAGHVRLWNMGFVNSTSLELVLGPGSAGRLVQSAPVANYYLPYESLPPARYNLQVFRAGDRQTPLKSFEVSLLDRNYLTVLVTQLPGSQLTAELIDDTPDPTKPTKNRLTVRQMCSTAHAGIATAAGQQTPSMEPGSVQTLEGLPDGVVPVTLRAMLPNGPKNWNGEADFRITRHATIFVIADAYGRLRLRASQDGPSPEDQDAAAAEFRSKP